MAGVLTLCPKYTREKNVKSLNLPSLGGAEVNLNNTDVTRGTEEKSAAHHHSRDTRVTPKEKKN